MKYLLSFVFLLSFSVLNAQLPEGYYEGVRTETLDEKGQIIYTQDMTCPDANRIQTSVFRSEFYATLSILENDCIILEINKLFNTGNASEFNMGTYLVYLTLSEDSSYIGSDQYIDLSLKALPSQEIVLTVYRRLFSYRTIIYGRSESSGNMDVAENTRYYFKQKSFAPKMPVKNSSFEPYRIIGCGIIGFTKRYLIYQGIIDYLTNKKFGRTTTFDIDTFKSKNGYLMDNNYYYENGILRKKDRTRMLKYKRLSE